MEVKNQNCSSKLKTKKPDIRYLADLRMVLYDKKFAQVAENLELYYMYRGVKEKNGLRYDITVIPPRILGEEFVKTKGHYHEGKYGELYFVLTGEVIFLIQKAMTVKSRIRWGEIADVYYVKAKGGNYVLIPPYYGHVIINPSFKILKTANWVSKKCKNNYRKIEERRGFCYYYTKSGWIKNKNYKKTPKLKFKKPLKSMPTNLDFLYGK